MSNDSIAFETELDKQDKQALLHHFIETSSITKKVLANVTILVLLIVFGILFLIWPSFHPVHLGIYLSGIVLTIMVVPHVTKKLLQSFLSKKELVDDAREWYALSMDRSGIFIQKENSNTELAWDDVLKAVSYGSYSFINVKRDFFIIIPEDVNVSEEKLEILLQTYAPNVTLERTEKAGIRTTKRAVIFISIAVMIVLVLVHFIYLN